MNSSLDCHFKGKSCTHSTRFNWRLLGVLITQLETLKCVNYPTNDVESTLILKATLIQR